MHGDLVEIGEAVAVVQRRDIVGAARTGHAEVEGLGGRRADMHAHLAVISDLCKRRQAAEHITRQQRAPVCCEPLKRESERWCIALFAC